MDGPKYQIGAKLILLDGYIWEVAAVEWDPVMQDWAYLVRRQVICVISDESVVKLVKNAPTHSS